MAAADSLEKQAMAAWTGGNMGVGEKRARSRRR